MKVAIFLTFLAIVATTQARFLFQQEWSQWKDYYGKQYSAELEATKQQTWMDNFMYVTKHNMEAAQGQHTYTLDMNRFADLNEAEWRSLLGLQSRVQGGSFCDSEFISDPHNLVVPKKVNWQHKGYVTPIKDQKQCGSCWAFSATGSLEGQHFAKTGKLIPLSEQNLMDCSSAEGNMACMGGTMDFAFDYISKHGIESEEEYPYQAKNETCKFDKSKVVATLKGCVDITQGSETALLDAVAKIGPISVAIDAGHQSFQLYSEGVYYEQACSQTRLDHGVLAVGYGASDDKDYWIVKNSWGVDWGMKGYIHMSRNRENNCGIASQASYPTL